MGCSSGYLVRPGIAPVIKKMRYNCVFSINCLFLWLAFPAVLLKIVGQYSKNQIFSRLNTKLEWILA
jgi:hypothetical protein